MAIEVEEQIGRPQERKSPKRPPKFEVLLHNDDFTTFEFVIAVLMRVFGYEVAQAEVLTLKVHEEGMAVAGMYIREIAEEKVDEVARMAQQADFPLRCTMRPNQRTN